jgi:hypothetical protein
VRDEVGAEDDDRHVERGGIAELHAHAVVEAGSVQDGDHAGHLGQPVPVKLEQPAALHLGNEPLPALLLPRLPHVSPQPPPLTAFGATKDAMRSHLIST